MKCISILQPWASLVVTTDPTNDKAYKQIETRSWNTKYRGPLLIHASAKWSGSQNDISCKEPFYTPLSKNGFIGGRTAHSCGLPLGAIIGMVNMVDTFKTIPGKRTGWYAEKDGRKWVLTVRELAFGDYSPGRYGWLLSDPIMFKNPIPCKGSLSIWNLPGELEEAVQEQIRMATAPSVLLATPGEGAVIVEAIKSEKWDPNGNSEFYATPPDTNKSIWD